MPTPLAQQSEIIACVKPASPGYRLLFMAVVGTRTGTYNISESREISLFSDDVERVRRREPLTETVEARQLVDDLRQQLMAMGYEPAGHGRRWFNYRFRRRVFSAMERHFASKSEA